MTARRPTTGSSLFALALAMLLALSACAPDDPAAPAAADRTPAAAPPSSEEVATAMAPPPEGGDTASQDTATGALPDELASFACRGTEPAWTLALSPDGATLQTDDGEFALAGELRQTSTGAWTWLSETDRAAESSYALLLSPSACFPGEGQRAEPYIAELSLPDGRRASGCCAPAIGD